ncbi:MAG TPA: hypothetical protein VG710_12370 [Opitutus sp.]|nr:hypothetical protein [Opitutus sp.]
MKKTTKPTNPLAPAKKSAKTVRKTTKSAAPAVKVAPTAVVTRITANFDVGFGNALYLRGDGPGLSWDKGVRMNCVADDKWTVTLGESVRPFIFKFLVNDEVWSTGEDCTVDPGVSVTLTPVF